MFEFFFFEKYLPREYNELVTQYIFPDSRSQIKWP